jgi:hypothetical protein
MAREIPESLRYNGRFTATEGRRDRLFVSFDQMARALATIPGSSGGYLVSTSVGDSAQALFGDSIGASLGVQVISGLSGPMTLPRPSTISGTWLGEGSSSSTTDPSFGSVTVMPKTLSVRTQISKQLLVQNPRAGDLVGSLMSRAAVKAADAALLSGAGGVEPLGVINAQGIQTQSGSSLNLSGVLAAQQAVVAAGASDRTLSFVSTPSIRQTLAAREIVSTTGLMLWRDGKVANMQAFVSNDCAASTAILGDFQNQCALALFSSGAEIAVDVGRIQLRVADVSHGDACRRRAVPKRGVLQNLEYQLANAVEGARSAEASRIICRPRSRVETRDIEPMIRRGLGAMCSQRKRWRPSSLAEAHKALSASAAGDRLSATQKRRRGRVEYVVDRRLQVQHPAPRSLPQAAGPVSFLADADVEAIKRR